MCFFQLSNKGKLPDTGLPSIQNGSMLMDFMWDPFDNHSLAAGQSQHSVPSLGWIYFRKYEYIYMHFLLSLNAVMLLVVEIVPPGRPEAVHPT